MQPWPADKVERRATSDLIPYIRNARVHSDEQIAQIAGSIREFGFTIPILIDEDNNVIAGHGRLLAAQKLAIDEVPVLIAAGWSDAKRRAYTLADNKLTENSSWDLDILRIELSELSALNFDITTVGFSADDLLSINEESYDGGGEGESGSDGESSIEPEEARASLLDRFGVAPFSVLNAREGWWQDRKRAWIGLGIKSELGRGGNLLEYSSTVNDFMDKPGARLNAKAATHNAQPGRHGRSPETETSMAFQKRISNEKKKNESGKLGGSPGAKAEQTPMPEAGNGSGA